MMETICTYQSHEQSYNEKYFILNGASPFYVTY